METQKILYLILLGLDVILRYVKNVNNTNFTLFLKNSKDHEVVSNGVFAIALEPQYGIIAERMRGRECLQIGITLFNTIGEIGRGLRVLKFLRDVLEDAEEVCIGRG